jgi:hypothetical protein
VPFAEVPDFGEKVRHASDVDQALKHRAGEHIGNLVNEVLAHDRGNSPRV